MGAVYGLGSIRGERGLFSVYPDLGLHSDAVTALELQSGRL